MNRLSRLLALSDERDRWQAVALDREHAAYVRGRETGYAAGHADGYARCDAEWMRAIAPARQLARRAAVNPSHAELERRRWGSGGREHFGDSRPSDYKGAQMIGGDKCRCGRPLLTRAGDTDSTCAECRQQPGRCECGSFGTSVAAQSTRRAAA